MNKFFIPLLAFVSASLIVTVLSTTYFQGRAFGAWGDDSPGYIYQAARFYDGEPIVFQNALIEKAFTYFDYPREVRWLMPKHYKPLNREGWIGSKYPVGAGLVMSALARLTGNEMNFYLMMPIAATATVILIFLVTFLALRSFPMKMRALASVLAVAILGAASLFTEYTLSQPMRDIPSVAFILLAMTFLLLARYGKWVWPFVIAAGISYGASLNIRHTGIVIFPAFIGLFIPLVKERGGRWVKLLALFTMVFGGIIVGTLTPTIYNSLQISEHKISFDSDEAETVLTSNVDHVESLSFANIFNNDGKFRAGEGALPHYWKSITNFSSLPFFLAAMLVGVVVLIKKDLWVGMSFAWAGVSIVALFYIWVNPYSRYIIPAFPILAVFGATGMVVSIRAWIRTGKTKTQRLIAVVLASGLIIAIFAPPAGKLYALQTSQELMNKSITQDDLEEIMALEDNLPGSDALLIMTGDWMFGLAEMVEGHANVQTIRFPRGRVDQDDAFRFIEKEVLPTYTTYLWMDSTTHEDVRELLESSWTLEPIGQFSYDFEPNVELYAIKN